MVLIVIDDFVYHDHTSDLRIYPWWNNNYFNCYVIFRFPLDGVIEVAQLINVIVFIVISI